MRKPVASSATMNSGKNLLQTKSGKKISNADVHARYQNGSTVLSWAAILGGAEHLKSLLNAGADVHARYDGGKTALMAAAVEGNAR